MDCRLSRAVRINPWIGCSLTLAHPFGRIASRSGCAEQEADIRTTNFAPEVVSVARRYIGSGNAAFTCLHCGLQVPPLRRGYRNHCPRCLWSLHVDDAPGDRAAQCGGQMQPVAVDYDGKKGYVIIHRCLRCSIERRNHAARSDPHPDDWEALVRLSRGQLPD